MKYSKRFIAASVFSVIPFLISTKGTDPYLDPGTGSMVLQVGIGFLVGGFLALKIFWNRIITFLRKLFPRGEKHEEAKQ